MIDLKNFELWFLTGSQHLYGEATLRQVASNSSDIVKSLNGTGSIAINIIHKDTVKTPDEILNICVAANSDPKCIGVITWMHTFSPAKMWIRGLNAINVPILHFHTQFNRDIPFDTIDMDFMNLNQSAHGDREYAHLLSKLNIPRTTIVGHWQSAYVIQKIDDWARLALGKQVMNNLKVVRFGDNMRYVAVTDGDKVSAEAKFGMSVNTHGVGDLAQVISEVPPSDIDALVLQYESEYTLTDNLLKNGSKRHSLIEAARIELGIKTFLQQGGYRAYTNTFEDLHGLRQLPGIASQRLMHQGYGFGAEGDWKTSALLHVMKAMAVGKAGGNSFMEDYTYHFDPLNEMVLGSHMLEICPSIAKAKPTCEVHPLGIGGKEDPVRLVFNASKGEAINVSLVDLGHRFRLIINKVEGVEVAQNFPNLPTARALWKTLPNMAIGLEAWLLAGGAHHTVYSQNISVQQMVNFGEMFDIETLTIDENTTISKLKDQIKLNEVYYR